MNKNRPAPSAWVERYAYLIPQGGTVLDLACGSGRHTQYLIERGHRVVAVDRDLSRLGDLTQDPRVSARQVDLESEPWPFDGEQCDGIVVTNYLHRPLLPLLITPLTPSGVLIYDTFSAGNERFGRPRNPDYLLRPGELLDVFGLSLCVKAYACGEISEPAPAVRQSICAISENQPFVRSSSAASDRP